MKWLFFSSIWCLLVFSCQEEAKKNYKELATGQTNVLLVGEEFVLYNSRTTGLQYNNSLDFSIDSSFAKLIDKQVQEADPDCAGCSHYYTYIYRAVKEGKTSIFVFDNEFARIERANRITDSLLQTFPQEILNDSLAYTQRRDSLLEFYAKQPILKYKIDLEIRNN